MPGAGETPTQKELAAIDDPERLEAALISWLRLAPELSQFFEQLVSVPSLPDDLRHRARQLSRAIAELGFEGRSGEEPPV